MNYSTDQFSVVNKKTYSRFIAEASGIGFNPSKQIKLRSHKTGKVITLTWMENVVENGDLVAWRYVNYSLVKDRTIVVEILND